MSKDYQNPREGSAFDGEREPLMAYTNPYVAPAELDAAIAAGNGMADNISVGSGGDLEAVDMTKEKGTAGASQTLSQTVAEAKKVAGAVIATPSDDSSWWLAPVVVVSYLFFDISKILAEGQSQHGTSINSAVLMIPMMVLNMILAYSLTTYFMGFRKGNAKLFEWDLLVGYALPSFCFSISQLFNLMQNVYLDASSRKAFSQLRILLTAVMTKFIMGTGYSNLQWLMIVSIVVSVFQFMYLKSDAYNPLEGKNIVVGLVFSLIGNIAAVLGSLLGEKHMKATKKNPFYLQKFQFEVWTFFFAFVGMFVFSPVGSIGADMLEVYASGGLKGLKKEGVMSNIIGLGGPAGKKSDLRGSVLRGTFYTVNDALSNVGFEAEVEGMKEKVEFSNRFNLKSWTGFQDKRADHVQKKILGGELSDKGYAKSSMLGHSLYPLIEKYAAVLYKTHNVPMDAKLNTWTERNAYLPDAEEKALSVSHATKYRKLAETVLTDTSFNTKLPLAPKTLYETKSDLRKTFSLHLGSLVDSEVTLNTVTSSFMCMGDECTPSKENKAKIFSPLRILERDAPGYSAFILKQDEKDDTKFVSGNIDKKGKFVPEATTTFTLISEADDSEAVSDLKKTYNLKAVAELEERVKALEELKPDIEGFEAKKKELEDAVAEMRTLLDAKNKSLKEEFAKQVEYVVKKDGSSEVTVTFSKINTLFATAMNPSDTAIVSKFGVAEKETSSIQFECKNRLDYSVHSIFSAKGLQGDQCKLLSTELKEGASYAAVPVMESKNPVFTKKNPVFTKASDDKKTIVIEKSDNIDKYMFKAATAKGIEAALKEVADSTQVWTFPGLVPTNACTPGACALSEEEQTRLGFKSLGVLDAANPNTQLKARLTAESYKDPFTFAVVHEYMWNPLPGYFFFRFWVALAIIANCGQSWTSALLSKVLSSLWKNICAAVAMALLVFVEKGCLATDGAYAQVRWAHLILGSAGIIITVFVFQMAPKENKGH